MKTMKEVIQDHLRAMGADGLTCEGCGCSIDDICLNDLGPLECVPAKKCHHNAQICEKCPAFDLCDWPSTGDEDGECFRPIALSKNPEA